MNCRPVAITSISVFVALVFGTNPCAAQLYFEVVKLTASDVDAFGYSVAVDGDAAIVGAPDTDTVRGAGFVFARDEGGYDQWDEVARLVAQDASVFDQLGRSVAIAGDLVVAGAIGDDNDTGAAYLFERNYGGLGVWGQVVKLTASNAAVDSRFGEAVAVSGDTVVIGARTAGHLPGFGYVFQRDQGGPGAWGEVIRVEPLTGDAGDLFGHAVALSDDTAVVGAPGDDDVSPNSGAAYVYERNQGGPNGWGEVTKLTASDGDSFGGSVAIDGDTMVVGSFGWQGLTGAAYIFERDHGGLGVWGEVIRLTAADGEPYDYFGNSVAISGDRIVIGAHGDDDVGSMAGAAYVFERDPIDPNAWNFVDKLTASDADADDSFGGSVALSGYTFISGAPDHDVGPFHGSAYIFQRVIFSDGFESGDTTAWSVTTP